MTSSSIPILYGMDLSPPVRAVILTAKAINFDIDYRRLDMFEKKEHMSEWYLKMNPQHTIPLLDDNGKYITDSHAIVAYLVTKYATDKSFYPTDPYQRALVDQRLHFDSGILFPRLRSISYLLFRDKNPNIPDDIIKNVYEAYDFLEVFLNENLYLCGNQVTIADFCSIATISSLQILVPADLQKYPKINQWQSRLSKLPYYQEGNGNMVEDAKKFIHDLIDKLKNTSN